MLCLTTSVDLYAPGVCVCVCTRASFPREVAFILRPLTVAAERDTIPSSGGEAQRGPSAQPEGPGKREREALCVCQREREREIAIDPWTDMEMGQGSVHLPLLMFGLSLS